MCDYAVMLQSFYVPHIPAQAWRNGAGLTRTLACDREHDWSWRISLATLDGDAMFSTFDGVDRTAVLVAGSGLYLRGESQSLSFDTLGQVHQFDGAWPCLGSPPPAGSQLLNTMVRRGTVRAHVQVYEKTCTVPLRTPWLALQLRGHSSLQWAGMCYLLTDALHGCTCVQPPHAVQTLRIAMEQGLLALVLLEPIQASTQES